MAEEVKAPETKVETIEAAKDWRSEPGAIAMAKQISELSEKLNARTAAEEAARKEAEETRLKAAGDFETLKTNALAEADAKVAAAEARVRNAEIKALTAGIIDEDIREGVIAKMEKLGSDVDMNAWISEYKTTKPQLWQQQLFPMQGSNQQAGRVNNNQPSVDWAKVKKLYTNGGNPQQTAAAINEVQKFLNKEGKLPPGF